MRSNNTATTGLELTNSNTQTRRRIRLNRHQIRLDDRKIMPVNRKDIVRPRGAIHKAKDVLLALGNGRVEVRPRPRDRIVALTINDNAVCPGDLSLLLNVVLHKGRVVDVVLDQHRTEVNIPVAAGRPVDDERAGEAIGVLEFGNFVSAIRYLSTTRSCASLFLPSPSHLNRLCKPNPEKGTQTHLQRIMRMIPRMSILQRPKLIRKCVSIRNGTLRHAIDAVHLHCVQLANAVPVDRRPVGRIVVLDMDDELVAPAGLDERAGKGLVENFAACFEEAVCCELK